MNRGYNNKIIAIKEEVGMLRIYKLHGKFIVNNAK